MRPLAPLATAGVIAVTAVVGCPSPEPTPPTCEDDVLACDEDLAFALADDCTPDERLETAGALELELAGGDGTGRWLALASDELPVVHSGPQGGQHVWAGVRVVDPTPGRSLHRLEFHFAYCPAGDDCSDEANWRFEAEEVDEDGPAPARTVIADASVFTTLDGGALELRDVLIFVFYGALGAPGDQRRLTVTAEDVCGRTGTIAHTDAGGE